jgi:hypothetical protein
MAPSTARLASGAPRLPNRALPAAVFLLVSLVSAAEGRGFGLSPEHPIGERQALEVQLRAAALTPRPPEERRSEDMGGAFQVLAWIDPEAAARAGASEHLQLLLGLDGTLRGVTGAFTVPGGSKRVQAVLERYWQEVAGAPPRFEEQAGASDWTPESRTARFSNAGARGTWMKIGASESVRIRLREGDARR